nr:unnamed protein product [Fasciola hepatica]
MTVIYFTFPDFFQARRSNYAEVRDVSRIRQVEGRHTCTNKHVFCSNAFDDPAKDCSHAFDSIRPMYLPEHLPYDKWATTEQVESLNLGRGQTRSPALSN